MNVENAAKVSDLCMVLVPDELQADLYNNYLRENLKNGSSLLFAHGLAIHFQLIKPRADLDVFMIAPKGPGHTVRGQYVSGAGVPCLIAIHQDASGKALDHGLSYASAIGGGRSGIIQTSFKEECEEGKLSSNFSAKTVLPVPVLPTRQTACFTCMSFETTF